MTAGERFVRKLRCSSSRVPTCSQWSLCWYAMNFSTILPTCATICYIPFFEEHHHRSIFPLLRNLCSLRNADDDVKQRSSRGGVTAEGNLKQLDRDKILPTIVPLFNERLTFVGSSIANCIPSGVFPGLWPKPSPMDGSTFGNRSFTDQFNVY